MMLADRHLAPARSPVAAEPAGGNLAAELRRADPQELGGLVAAVAARQRARSHFGPRGLARSRSRRTQAGTGATSRST